MTKELELFVEYLTIEKQASHNTVISYERDLNKMVDYLQANGCRELSQVTQIRLTSYVLELEKEGMKASTISRNIAAMKAFFHFCERRKLKEDDPAEDLKAPKIEKKLRFCRRMNWIVCLNRLMARLQRNYGTGACSAFYVQPG